MGVIQYYLPGANSATVADDGGKIKRNELEAVGVLKALNDIEQVPRDCVLNNCTKGPDGGAGLVITPTRPDGRDVDACYRPDSQTWTKADNGRYWLGTKSGEPITPADLSRRQMYAGYQVTVGANLWLIPIARSADEQKISLPQDVRFVGGQAVTTLRQQYRKLWDIAGAIVGWRSGDEDSPAQDRVWRIQAAMEAMTVNYRAWHDEVNLAEMAACPILSTEITDLICLSLADITFAAELKKNLPSTSTPTESDSADSSVGTEDGSNIAPVGAS